MSRPNEFDSFCRTAFDFLDGTGVPFLVIGGLAVVALGEPRTTADVDVVAFASPAVAEGLIERAQRAGFTAAPDERQKLLETGTLRFRKGRWQLDVIIASLPFEEVARTRALPRRLFGRTVSLPTPEDLLLFKVIAGRDKDMVDAVGIARRHEGRLDLAYLQQSLEAVCELAEDDAPIRRLADVLRKAAATTS